MMISFHILLPFLVNGKFWTDLAHITAVVLLKKGARNGALQQCPLIPLQHKKLTSQMGSFSYSPHFQAACPAKSTATQSPLKQTKPGNRLTLLETSLSITLFASYYDGSAGPMMDQFILGQRAGQTLIAINILSHKCFRSSLQTRSPKMLEIPHLCTALVVQTQTQLQLLFAEVIDRACGRSSDSSPARSASARLPR
jgi:hypothetical protein